MHVWECRREASEKEGTKKGRSRKAVTRPEAKFCYAFMHLSNTY